MGVGKGRGGGDKAGRRALQMSEHAQEPPKICSWISSGRELLLTLLVGDFSEARGSPGAGPGAVVHPFDPVGVHSITHTHAQPWVLGAGWEHSQGSWGRSMGLCKGRGISPPRFLFLSRAGEAGLGHISVCLEVGAAVMCPPPRLHESTGPDWSVSDKR